MEDYYYFKLLNHFRQQLAFSKENFCKPRAPQHTYYYILVILVAGMKKVSEKKYSTLENNKNSQSHPVTDPLGENSRNPAKNQEKSVLKPNQKQ